MSRLFPYLLARLREYGHPRTTWYGVISGALLTTAALTTTILQSQGLNRQITPWARISDLVWYVAWALALGLWFRLGWSLARTQRIRDRINTSSWAVTVAAGMFALVEVNLSFFATGPVVFAGFLHIWANSLAAGWTAGVWTFLLFSYEFLALFVLVAVPGSVICLLSVLLSRLLHRSTVLRETT